MLRADLLSIYLNDHLAGATGGVELFKRSASSQHDPMVRDELGRLGRQVVEDRDSLVQIMRRLGVQPRTYMSAIGWVGEKAGRLKPNGRIVKRSPVSDLAEFDALVLGVEGKLALWQLLRELAADDARLEPAELDRLATRAVAQLATLRSLRLSTGRSVLVGTPARP
jgi:hypothetical protein